MTNGKTYTYRFVVQDIPVTVTRTDDHVRVDAGHDNSPRHLVTVFDRKKSGLTVVSKDLAQGLAVSQAAAWNRKDRNGGW